MDNLTADDEYEIWNDHPKKLYRIHVVGYHEPRPGALEAFADRFPGREFFHPSANRTYRSRSGALDRVALLDFNGVDAVVVEADPEWKVHETKEEKIARLEARVAELEAGR